MSRAQPRNYNTVTLIVKAIAKRTRALLKTVVPSSVKGFPIELVFVLTMGSVGFIATSGPV